MPLVFNPLAPYGFDKTGSGGGGEGPPGPKGEFNFRQAWKAATAYAKGDAVTVGGTTYACIQAMTAGEDVEPPNATFWAVVAEKGAAGATGEKGTTGEKGATGEAGSPKTAKAPLEVAGTEIALKVEGVIAEYLGSESVTTAKIKLLAVTAATLAAEAVETTKIKDKAVTDAKLAGLSWVNVEALTTKLEPMGAPYATALQCAVFNGMVFLRGAIKVKEEVASKTIIFTLPAAARPSVDRRVPQAGGTAGEMYHIKANGEVEVIGIIKTTHEPTLDGVTFSL